MNVKATTLALDPSFTASIHPRYRPAGASEVREDFRRFGSMFPNATVVASTLTDFFSLIDSSPVLTASLPILTSEIGDTWMYGCASDPLKVAQMRAMQRAFAACHHAGRCSASSEPQIEKFLHYTLKLFEHTWGGSTAAHMNVSRSEVERVWTVEQLAQAKTEGRYKFINKMEATWTEQRLFIDKALNSLEQPGNTAVSTNRASNTNTGNSTMPRTNTNSQLKPHRASALALAIREEFKAITQPAPTARGLHSLNFSMVPRAHWSRSFSLGRVTVAFDGATGALVQLDSANHSEGKGWASASNPIGRFGYRGHSYDEWDHFMRTYMYTHGGQHPHRPTPNSPLTCQQMNNCSTVAKLWHAAIVTMWYRNVSANSGAKIVIKLALPQEPRQLGYGAPATVFLSVSQLPASEGMVDMEVVWASKPPSRLYEGIYFDMRPRLRRRAHSNSAEGDSSWTLFVDKLGSRVDVSDVVRNGGSAVHGMDPGGGVSFVSHTHPSLHVWSRDAALVLPAQAGTVMNFSVFYDTPVDPTDGVSFNLYNNVYWTNYVLWYPWLQDRDSLSRFRFRLSVTP